MAKLGPLPDNPGVVKIRLIGKGGGQAKWVNVLHAKVTGTLSAATLNTVATSIRGFWTSDFAPVISSSYSLQTVEITDLSTRSGNQGVDSVGANGTGSSGALPASVAACLTLKIAQRYRGGHPRLYLPGVPLLNSTDGVTWASGIANGYQSAGRAFLGHVNGITTGATAWALCAASYYHKVGGVEAYKVPPDNYLITDVLCHTRIDSQRKRLGKETS